MAFILYDEEEVLRSYIESERYEAARATAIQLLKTGKLTPQEIAVCVPDISLEEIEKIQKELLQTV